MTEQDGRRRPGGGQEQPGDGGRHGRDEPRPGRRSAARPCWPTWWTHSRGASVCRARFRGRRRARRRALSAAFPAARRSWTTCWRACAPPNADGADRRVLVATSDTPFLTPESVDDFIRQSSRPTPTSATPSSPSTLCRARFPQMKRTTLRLREGTFTGGNMMLLNPRFIFAHEQTILRGLRRPQERPADRADARLGSARRASCSPRRSPRPSDACSMEAGVSRLLGAGCRARAIVTPYPEVGTDVDKPDDVAIAQQMLAGA